MHVLQWGLKIQCHPNKSKLFFFECGGTLNCAKNNCGVGKSFWSLAGFENNHTPVFPTDVSENDCVSCCFAVVRACVCVCQISTCELSNMQDSPSHRICPSAACALTVAGPAVSGVKLVALGLVALTVPNTSFLYTNVTAEPVCMKRAAHFCGRCGKHATQWTSVVEKQKKGQLIQWISTGLRVRANRCTHSQLGLDHKHQHFRYIDQPEEFVYGQVHSQ